MRFHDSQYDKKCPEILLIFQFYFVLHFENIYIRIMVILKLFEHLYYPPWIPLYGNCDFFNFGHKPRYSPRGLPVLKFKTSHNVNDNGSLLGLEDNSDKGSANQSTISILDW